MDVKYILKNLQFSSVSFIHLQSSGRLKYYKVPYNIEHLKLEKTKWAPTFSLEISVSEKPPGHARCSDSHCLHAGLYHSTFHWIYTPHRATVATLMGIRMRIICRKWKVLETNGTIISRNILRVSRMKASVVSIRSHDITWCCDSLVRHIPNMGN